MKKRQQRETKKNRKKCLAGFLSVPMILSLTLPALAAEAPQTVTRKEACDLLVAAADDYQPSVTTNDVLYGYNGDLALERAVTRLEALLMLSRAFGELPEPIGNNARGAYPGSFEDIPAWAADELENVLKTGIITGTDEKTLSPDEAITSNELDLLIRRVFALKGTNLKDDFYATVNKDWLDTAETPPGYPYTGTLFQLDYDVTQQVNELIRNIVASSPKTGSPEEKIKTLYENCLDWDSRNQVGIEPLRPYLEAIDNISSMDELTKVHQQISKDLNAPTLVGFGTDVDTRDSNRYILVLGYPAPNLNKEDYANDSATAQAFQKYLTTLLVLSGESQEDAAAHAQACYQLEKALSAVQMDVQDYGDVSKTSTLYSLADLEALMPEMDLKGELEIAGFSAADAQEVRVTDVELMKKAASYMNEEYLEQLKSTMKLNLLFFFGSTLNHEFTDAANEFETARYGTDMSLPDEETAAQQVQSILADYLSKAYVEKYFSAEAKADVENMIDDFLDIYENRIQNLDWMSDAIKKKALEKLDTMTVKVGYPDSWDSYLDNAELKSSKDGGSYFDNLLSISRAAKEKAIADFKNPVDKTAWLMSAFTVNAYYDPTANSINFPAGILQAPLYDVEADHTQNLGGIGYVIAHEMTHAFDNNGAMYDSKGNAANWWTEEDYQAFEKLCEQAVSFYDGIEAAPGIACNGSLTLSENIADLGAIACVTQAESQENTPDYATLYRSASQAWTFTAPREAQIYLSQADVHAPGKLRGNRVLQSCDEFYSTFDIQPNDGMWLDPENRVQIW